MVQGTPARRIGGDRAMYLYVAIEHPSYQRGPVDVYVVAEVFDDTIGRLARFYDKDSPAPNLQTKYSPAGDTMLLVGTKTWRRGIFHLPDLRLGHGQNSGADFRFAGAKVALRRITVTPRRPADYDPDHPVPADVLQHLAVVRPSGMELTYGNDASPADAALFKALSVTSVESYVDWAGVEPEEGKWDWSKWDRQVATLQKAGLKWVPFLIAGPAYATPRWFQNGPDSHVYRCLEHGKDSKVQSLFNPRLRPQVERFVRAFADRYRDKGVIESILLGITGIYGESIYPAGPEGGWTAGMTGAYHNHAGWWAADARAVADFRKVMTARYRSIDALNRAWGSSHRSFDDITTFLPDKAPSDRACADFVEWYQQAMTDWSVFWVQTTRQAFPGTEIYLCTGGDGLPMLGADFTAQTAAIAPFGAGVRITNEGSDYLGNYGLTREVATATRLYGTFCGFEPASHVDAGGVIARIYNATASGAPASRLHPEHARTRPDGPGQLPGKRPVPRSAPAAHRDGGLSPARNLALDPAALGRVQTLARTLRDVADLDYVTRRSVSDGHLRSYRVLVLADSSVLEPKAAEAIEAWVRDGGTLLAVSRPGETLGGRLYDNASWRSRLLVDAPAPADLLRPVLEGNAPAHWSLQVGGKNDETWLFGDWNGSEAGHAWREIPGATMRWSGAHPGVLLPVQPGADHVLKLSLSVPDAALGSSGIRVELDGQSLGVIRKPGTQVAEFRLPARLVGKNSVIRLELAVHAWKPSEREPGNKDTRTLGVSVHEVEVIRAGAATQPAKTANVRFVLDSQRLAPLTRTVGKGRTIALPGREADRKLIALALAGALPSPVDGKLDGRFATVTDTGVLWFDKAEPRIWQTSR